MKFLSRLKLNYLTRAMLMVFAVVAVLAASASPATTAPLPPPDTIARSAVLIDADDNGALFGKNENEVVPPASTTKIMTAILALESGKLDQPITISQNAVSVEPSVLGLHMGDQITMREALTGMMIVSGNDAAVAIAETIAGSVPAFANMMNEKAKELGATNTHFVNPNGLTEPDHYSTAHDMALIASYAMKNPEFRHIVSLKDYNVQYMDGHTEYVTTTNHFLESGFKGANGIKTGFTNAAGDCLVASATRGQKTLIAVFYNDDDRWTDAPAWLEYGFSYYTKDELGE